MKVLYCAAECKPFAKMGGVGDVAGELPLALKDIGVDIQIALPLYGSIDKKYVEQEHSRFDVRYAGGTEEVTVYKGKLKDVPVFFFQNARFFEGRYSKPYVHSEQTPFWDDIIRFSFFSEALLGFVKNYPPDIVHINDWVLGYLFGRMAMEGFQQKRVLTVHNVGYQGNLYEKQANDLHIKLLLDDPQIGPLFADPRREWRSVNALRLVGHSTNHSPIMQQVLSHVSPTQRSTSPANRRRAPRPGADCACSKRTRQPRGASQNAAGGGRRQNLPSSGPGCGSAFL